MNKSILIMNTPKNCRHCPVFGGGLCKEAGASIYNFTRPNRCPLRDAPYKRDEKEPLSAYGVYAKGWNACVNEILREAVEIEYE